MTLSAFRLAPNEDLRESLEKYVAQQDLGAAAVVTCVGSLTSATLRMADENITRTLEGPFEIVSLTGTLSTNGCHCHIAISDREGQVMGGHLAYGCRIYTTAELVIARLEGVVFKRLLDPLTGFDELVVDAGSDR